MDRISAANTAPGNLFRDGNGAEQKATSFNAAWANDVQETLLFPIELSGRAPATGDYTQLFRALVDLIYFVGKTLIIAANTNPNTLYPWQTWTEDVSNRVTISRNPSVVAFDTVGKVGGATTGTATVTIPRDGWGAQQSSGSLPEPTTSGRLVTGSGNMEDSENLESLGHAAADRPFSSAAFSVLPPYIVRRVWVRTA